MYRSWNASGSVNKCFATIAIYRHDRGIAKQTTKLYCFANGFTYNRDDTYSCCFLINHTDGCLVCYDSTNGACWSVTRNRYHVKTN